MRYITDGRKKSRIAMNPMRLEYPGARPDVINRYPAQAG
jgi:hypothetical protein